MNTATTPNIGGAPANNTNALVHGRWAFLRTGRLPKKRSYTKRQLNGFAHALDDAIVSKHGEISLVNAARKQSVLRHEGRAALLAAYLREQEAELSLADRMALLREISQASDARDKALAALDIDKPTDSDPWAALDVLSHAPEPKATTQPNASQATPEAIAHGTAPIAPPLGDEYARATYASEGQP
jgi:hypothetical protein